MDDLKNRLTDEQIEGMSRWAEEPNLPGFAMYCGPRAAAELHARRAADLTTADLATLREIRDELAEFGIARHRALALLNRLLAQETR